MAETDLGQLHLIAVGKWTSYAVREFEQMLREKLLNTSCPDEETEEILTANEIIAVTVDTHEYPCDYCKDSYEAIFDDYVAKVMNMVLHKEEPNWNEIKENMLQILQDFRESVTVSVDKPLANIHSRICVPRTDSFDESFIFNIENKCFIPRENFILIHKGHTLKPGQSLANLNLGFGSVIHLRVKEEVTISVEELDGTQRILKGVRKSESVDSLVGKVENKYRIPKRKFILTHNGDILKPGQSLANLNITDGSHILLLRVKEDFAIIVEDLNDKRHIITGVREQDYGNSLIGKVVHKTGIPRSEMALINNEEILKPRQKLANWNIHDGSEVLLLPVEKGHKQPTDLEQFVNDLFKRFNGQIEKFKRLKGNLCRIFPQFVLDCTRTLSDQNFVAISSLVCGMKFLGKKLGLDKVTCDQIECDYPDSEGRRIFEMLRKWSQINYGEVTVGVLISAIKESKVTCEFKKLKSALSL